MMISMLELSYLIGSQLKQEVTYQSYVEKLIIVPDIGEGGGDVGVEVIPAKAELLCRHLVGHDRPGQISSSSLLSSSLSIFLVSINT